MRLATTTETATNGRRLRVARLGDILNAPAEPAFSTGRSACFSTGLQELATRNFRIFGHGTFLLD